MIISQPLFKISILCDSNRDSDSLTGTPTSEHSSLLDFWRWAYRDLCDDDNKGIFAEWMVARLLNIPTERRISWANSDIITSGGVRIEVKSSAYWQSWKHLNEFNVHYDNPKYLVSDKKRIVFAGLASRNALNTLDKQEVRALKSHLYVFAFQHEKELSAWNAMDLTQWEFYIERAEALQGKHTVTLEWLRDRQQARTAADFVTDATKILLELENTMVSDEVIK